MKRVLLCLLLLALMVSFSVAAVESQVDNRDIQLFIGYERQHPLSQDVDFDGPVLGLVFPVSKRWFIYSEASFQSDSIRNNDFELNRQQITLGYKFWDQGNSFWQVELGTIREQFEQQIADFSGQDSDTGYLGKLGWHYLFNDRHQFAIQLQGHLLYETNRYLVHNQYRYQVNQDWSVGARFSLGYDETFQHDLNEYRLHIAYHF
ncbi:DUF481 domain-containing protein [Thalassotalea litorea]|uniref:DUF481 domain-containing protein n=1 Tax=Thalassotalea litorea TaxID=2020715 RepID=A0A5R9IML1_9GAMM|nr:DUF481 domain-containing protein [Thalassotalea litorea]TLU66770.1 DUF481 domain-containing protein [Thalassotalea litorea]